MKTYRGQICLQIRTINIHKPAKTQPIAPSHVMASAAARKRLSTGKNNKKLPGKTTNKALSAENFTSQELFLGLSVG
ncbi:MAG: hypothetical protein AB8C84_02770 [Oligoflexales bacterium]